MPNPKVISKKVLVLAAGLAGSGKTTHLEAFNNRILNGVYIEKDIVNSVFVPPDLDLNSEFYKKHVKDQTYKVLFELSKGNFKENRVVILDGYFGDKLSSPLVKSYRLLVCKGSPARCKRI